MWVSRCGSVVVENEVRLMLEAWQINAGDEMTRNVCERFGAPSACKNCEAWKIGRPHVEDTCMRDHITAFGQDMTHLSDDEFEAFVPVFVDLCMCGRPSKGWTCAQNGNSTQGHEEAEDDPNQDVWLAIVGFRAVLLPTSWPGLLICRCRPMGSSS